MLRDKNNDFYVLTCFVFSRTGTLEYKIIPLLYLLFVAHGSQNTRVFFYDSVPNFTSIK